MEGKRPKQIPLACRFLPYDQWFLTHIDPTWKIKHIKQIILAKCLSLSFDPRKLARETTGVRPPSPITFAPDESRRPASPIKFATPQEVRRKKSQMHAAGERGWLDEGDGSGAAGVGVSSSGGSGGRGTGSGEGGFFGDDEGGLGIGIGIGIGTGLGMGMGIGLSGIGGEEGYEEDDEWDDEDDIPSGRLISPGKRSSIVMGGRVQVPGGTPNWFVAGSPPAAPASSSSAAAATPTSPMKIRNKFNPLAKIAASSFTVNVSTSSAPPTAALSTSLPTDIILPNPNPSQHPPPIQSPTPQIYTALYTLIRFSTGQILEEDIPVSWYDLLPNELVELHASIPPLSFGMSKRMGWNLMYPREMMEAYREWDVKVVVERRMRGKDKSGEKEKEKKKNAANTMNTTNGIGSGSVSTYNDQDPPTLPYPISSSLTLVSLPRHDPYLYAQPYWEGWVRALRMVYCDAVSPSGSRNTSHNTTTGTATGSNTNAGLTAPSNAPHMPMQEYAMGMTNFSGSLAGGLAGAGVAVGGSGSSGVGVGVGVGVTGPTAGSSNTTSTGTGGASGSGSAVGGGGGAGITGGQGPKGHTGQSAQGRTDHTHTTRHHTRMEWRERYVVIKDGVVNLFKSRDDLAPTHRLPLNNLLSLRDASHVLPIVNNRNTRLSEDPTINGGTGTGTGGPPSPAATVTPSHSHSHSNARMKPSNRGTSVTPAEGVSGDRDRDRDRYKDRDRDGAQRKRRSTSLPRSGTSTLKDPRRGEGGTGPRRMPAPASSSSLSSSKSNFNINFNAHPQSSSGSRADVDERGRASSSYPHPHAYSHPRPLTEAEIEGRRKEAEKKQKEREKRERQRRQQEQDLKEMEYLKQWDDLRFGWSKGKEKDKGKAKEKEKEKEKGKGKEGEKEKGKGKEKEKGREGDLGRMSERARVGETSSKGRERERESDRDREREKDRDREREKQRRREKDRDRERQRQREKEKAQRDERTFIPTSKEEAEAAGMKIVCAKFRHLRPWDKEYLDRELALLDSRNQSLINPVARMAVAASAAATASSNTLGAPGGAVASSAVSALSGSSSALSGGSTPRYTSTGPSLAGSTVTVNVNVNAASEAEDGPGPGFTFGLGLGKSGERMKHSRNMFSVSEGSSTNNSSNHPYQQSTSAISAISGPPRKSSFPTLVGLLGSSASASASAAVVAGAASSNQSSLTLAPSSISVATATTSSLALYSVTSGSSSMGAAGGGGGGVMAAIASSASASAAASPIVSGPPKFIGGLFGKDKDKDKTGDGSATTDKEERKREEKERKAREKEQKALEKEKKKAAKRKEKEETGDEDDGVGTTSSGWKLRLIPSSSGGRVKEREMVRESMDTQATVTASLSSPQPIAVAPSSSTLLPGRYMEEDRAQAVVTPSYRSIKLAEEQQQDKPRSSISLPNLRDDTHPLLPSNRPKLTLSPVKDQSASTSASAPPNDQVSTPKETETTNVNEDDAEVDPEQHSPGHLSDSGSSSRSLSSPVFAHSGDDGESGEDFDDEFGIGVSGYRRDRMGYRYGGFHQAQARKLEKEKEAGKAAGGAAALASAEVTPAPPAPTSALTPADQAVRGVQSRVAVGDVAEVGGTEKGRDGENGSGTGPDRRDISQTRSTQSQPQRRLRKREDERGEWIVLDMGNEQAYNSMLRVLHRCFAQPLTSTFVNPSISDGQPVSSSTAPPAQTRSPLNSPTQSTFWSTTTLVGVTGSDARSVVSERTKSLRTADSFSSMYVPPPPPSSRQHEHEHGQSHGRLSTTGSDADEENAHANPAQAPVAPGPYPVENNQAQDPSSVQDATSTQSRVEHPPVLQTSSKPPKRGALAPALHYPEWRLEIVQRAKRHGLREAGRPLDLALNGLNAEMDERDIRARVKVWEERERRRRKLEEQEAQRMDEMRMRELQERVDGEEDAEEGDDDEEEEEEEASSEDESDDGNSGDDEQQPTGFDEEQKRMSAISHASTLNAMQMNAAAAAAIANRPSAATTDQTFVLDEDDDHDAPEPSAAHAEDELVAVSEDDEFKQRYSFQYGHEDEEDAIALGMESFMEDSDEESETEWLAWVTDLPRQVEVRARKRAEREKERKRLEQERQQRQLEVPVEGEGRDIQLSPMVFSDPFAHDQDHPSQPPSSHNGSETNLVVHVERSLSESRMSFNGSIRSGSSSLPISQAEERRQVVESRRMMEPTATSTFMRISTPPPQTSVLPVQQPTSAPTSGVGLQNLLSQANTTSISAGPSVPPISIKVSSATAGPRSPQLGSFSPESDVMDGYRDAPSSSTTPPSAGVHYQAKLMRAKTHSRAPSGDASTRLHHSTSMPFAAAPAAGPSALAVSGNSVPSTPPKSPMRSVSASISNSTTTGVSTSSPSRANPIQRAQHPVEMPILTQEQIQQIEAETDLMIKQNSTRMSSSPAPSSYTSHTPVSLPRRSSSAGTGASVPGGFASGSSPSRTMPGSSSESRMGGAGSMGRSASVLVKPHAPEVGSGGSERERRGVLRKRLSDLGKQISGDEKDGSPTSKSKKPKLSLAGLGGGGSSSHSHANNQPQSDVHSPTNPYQRQGLRSPTISNASSSAYTNTHGGAGGGVVGSGSGSSGTMASAKALLRRVRSGSSLRMDMHTEEHENPVGSNYPVPNSPTSAAFSSSGGSWGRETSPDQSRKRKGPVERLVKGLDSALEFRDGR